MKERILKQNKQFMKTSILILFMALPFLGYAQADLKFNQVKLVSSLETVPVGMVWKVTGVMPSSNVANTTIKVNGKIVSNIVYSNGTPTMNNIYWLPAGTTLEAGSNNVYISVIEFSI